jgi:hypothetical protein
MMVDSPSLGSLSIRQVVLVLMPAKEGTEGRLGPASMPRRTVLVLTLANEGTEGRLGPASMPRRTVLVLTLANEGTEGRLTKEGVDAIAIVGGTAAGPYLALYGETRA